MNIFKGFFCYLYFEYYKNNGLFGVAFIFVALLSLILFGILFLTFNCIELMGLDIRSSDFKFKGAIISLICTVPVYFFFKKIKEPYLNEFDKLNEQIQLMVLKRSKYIFYSFFIVFALMVIGAIIIR